MKDLLDKHQAILDLSDVQAFYDVDKWKHENHAHIHHELASIEMEISVECSDGWDRLIEIKFFGHSGKWYLPEYNVASDGNFTIKGKYKDNPRIFIEYAVIESNPRLQGMYEHARQITEIKNAQLIKLTYEKLYDLLTPEKKKEIDCISE